MQYFELDWNTFYPMKNVSPSKFQCTPTYVYRLVNQSETKLALLFPLRNEKLALGETPTADCCRIVTILSRKNACSNKSRGRKKSVRSCKSRTAIEWLFTHSLHHPSAAAAVLRELSRIYRCLYLYGRLAPLPLRRNVCVYVLIRAPVHTKDRTQ